MNNHHFEFNLISLRLFLSYSEHQPPYEVQKFILIKAASDLLRKQNL